MLTLIYLIRPFIIMQFSREFLLQLLKKKLPNTFCFYTFSDWVSPVGLCVGLGPWTDVSSLANASSTSTTWLLVPTDGVPTDVDLHSLAEGTLVVDPRVDLAVQGNGNGSVSYALFLDVAAGVVALVGRYQAALRNRQCENGTETCNPLPPFQVAQRIISIDYSSLTPVWTIQKKNTN